MHFGDDELSRHFGQIWPVHVEHFTELLIALRREFNGDLDRMLVLGVIGMRTLPPQRVAGRSFAEFQAGQLAQQPRPINVQSIAETTGIPRETVRRKVAELQAAGWIERRDDGHLMVAPRAREDLAPATQATMRYLVAVGAACVAAAG
ncbi:MarR family transcriptional regulator [Thioalkalivibrio sp. XN279]|uniref:MarR family transcriptional regulator n=1 Tax=Thioalkalivibrio sp. XN279 TaxID=2714953 RepID=UPI00140DC429|nr:MarR family transcriptional regulator [Thioalkalivibrio sp. XN279]NHA14035.1 MarR family transcriptional regulator [Thioalkalivibrio sp. XN279]